MLPICRPNLAEVARKTLMFESVWTRLWLDALAIVCLPGRGKTCLVRGVQTGSAPPPFSFLISWLGEDLSPRVERPSDHSFYNETRFGMIGATVLHPPPPPRCFCGSHWDRLTYLRIRWVNLKVCAGRIFPPRRIV
jgi:hypothetical protein